MTDEEYEANVECTYFSRHVSVPNVDAAVVVRPYCTLTGKWCKVWEFGGRESCERQNPRKALEKAGGAA